MPTIEFEIDVSCGQCGTTLSMQSAMEPPLIHGTPCLEVQPCKYCVEKARSEGHDKGHAMKAGGNNADDKH